MQILHVDSSITGEGFLSRFMTASILERLPACSNSATVTYRDLIADSLPHMNLKHLPGSHPASIEPSLLTENEKTERGRMEAVLKEFLLADVLVLGVPMYNFGVPSQLKAWLDAIVVPGKTVTYTAEGFTGLASRKRVILAVSRGSLYGEAGFPLSM